MIWIEKVNKIELGHDGLNHNKLRFYCKLKGSFTKEPYLDLVPNRTQHADLTRLRISSSRLAIELQRYHRPPVPALQRYCSYCRPAEENNLLQGYVDDEMHFLLNCSTFAFKRNCFLSKLETVLPGFKDMSAQQMAVTILCPVTTIAAKLANKYIKILFDNRKQLDEGIPILNLGYEKGIACNPFFTDHDSDIDDILTD